MASTAVTFDIIGRDRASSAFNKVGDAANQAQGKTSKFGATMAKVAKAAAIGLAAAGVVAVKFGASAVGAASDLNETMNKTSVVFGDAANGVIAWSKDSATALGLSQQAALAFTSQFGDMFVQLGATRKEAATTSQGIVKLATDLGSFHNLETGEVLDKIAGAMRGEYDAIQKIIPGLSDARVKQEALNATGKESVDALTEQDKAMAALAIVQKDGAAAADDFAETSGGLANQQKILRAQFEDVQATIGQKLLPVAVKVVTWANDSMIPALTKLGSMLEATAKWVQRNSDVIVPLVAVFGTATAAITTVIGVTKAWAKAQAVLNLVMAANPLVLVIGLVVGLGLALVVAYKKSETFRNVVTVALNKVKAGVQALGAAGKWLWNNVFQPVFSFIVSGVAKVLLWFGKMLQLIGKAPKMGWVGELGDKLVGASGKAQGLADSINKIPDSKTFTLKFNVAYGPGAGAALGVALGGGNGRVSVDGASSQWAIPGGASGKVTVSGPNARTMARGSGDDGRPLVVQMVVEGRVIEQVLIKHVRTTGRPLQVKTLGPA